MPTNIDSQELTMNLLANPINLPNIIIEDMEMRFNGDYTIVDPNNTCMHLVEMASNLTAGFAALSEQSLSVMQSTLRAQTSEDLYKHMSDYDYVNMFSSPASIEIMLTFDKQFLFNNAYDFDSITKKIIIPQDTTFKVGNLTFGIYYPIEILINKYTGTPLVIYNTDLENPLQQLNYNLVPFSEYTYLGMKMIQLKFRVHQFIRTKINETLIAQHGFASKYSYTDKFFALRAFTEKGDDLIELKQTLAKNVYDPYVPTIRLAVEPEINKFSVNIPQIYFTDDLLGRNLYLEVFTTKGDITTDISNLSKEQYKVNFNLNKTSSKYSQILSKTSMIMSLVSTQLGGGSNGYDFSVLRQKIINNAFTEEVLVTPAQIESYYQDKGFKIIKHKDNLTNLIYFSHKVLVDSENSIVPVTNLPLAVSEDTFKDVSTILKNSDGTITILPTTIYTYNQNKNIAEPVVDSERNRLAKLSKEDKINEFNTNIYLKSPYHIRVIPDGRYTQAASYSMMLPTINDFIFVKDNPNIMVQMVAISGIITHENNGEGGYKLQLVVNKSADLIDVDESNLKIYLSTLTVDKRFVGIELNYVSEYGTNHLYECKLTTDYTINRNGQLNITSLTDDKLGWSQFLNMTNEYFITFCVSKTVYPSVITETSLYAGLPIDYQNKYAVMIRQKCTISLGNSLEDVIYNNIDSVLTQQEYLRHEVDVPLTYTHDVYETDENGVPRVNVDIIDGKPVVTLNKLHSAGEIVKDEYTGEELYSHRKGDFVIDSSGKPIQTTERIRQLYIQAMMIDYKLWLSEYPVHRAYVNSIPMVLENYFSIIRDSIDRLLERDKIYFRPTETLGMAKFDIGDGVLKELPLNMKMELRLHCDPIVIADESIQSTIESTILKLIEPLIANDTICMTAIANEITSRIDYISAVDVLGINGTIDLQTITITDKQVQPSIAQELYLSKDNMIMIRKAITIKYVSN